MAKHELRFEECNPNGDASFTNYECEHVTAKQFPAVEAVSTGPYTNLILCRHCWDHVRGKVAVEMVEAALLKQSPSELLWEAGA